MKSLADSPDVAPWTVAVRRLERLLYRGGWAVRVARAVGLRPEIVRSVHTVEAPVIPAGQALRIAFASDFHVGPTTDAQVVSAACRAIVASRPDVVLLGGDFVNFEPRAVDQLVGDLKSVAEVAPCYAVLGNHDWVAGAAYIKERLESLGIAVLVNRHVQLASPFECVWICGLDDHWSGRPDAGAALAGAGEYRIVLMHAPSGLLDIGAHRFQLALCGHTHGGQIALPGGQPIVLPQGALSRRYSRGRFELANERTLIVSTGVGCAFLPFRLNADPEVLLCTLVPPAGG
jgi:predicted MPP superfamily phosphohydrolase